MKRKLYNKFRKKTPIAHISDKNNLWIAGRIVSIKDGIATIEDESGNINIPINENINFKYLDIVAIKLRIENGEFVIEKSNLLTRASNDVTLTNNWQRAISNTQKKESFIKREKIIQKMRNFFINMGFLEINTPYLVFAPSTEESLIPFKTKETITNHYMYLTMSPEYNLKRFLSMGLEKIFQIAHSFRNNDCDRLHNPEFLNLEWYRAYADYTDIMDDISFLLPEIAQYANGNTKVNYGGRKIDLSDIEKISIKDLFFNDFKEELEFLTNVAELKRTIKTQNIYVDNLNKWNDLFYAWIVQKEPHLGLSKPCILYDYPRSCAALSRIKEENDFYAERFELYVGGIEIANAYSELNDPKEQLKRLKSELNSHPDIPLNRDFQKTLEIGMPPSGGIAFGIDRFIMVLLGENSIHNIMPLSFHNLKDEINISQQ